MHSFFLEEKFGDKFVIKGDDLHHLRNVVKLKTGEEIYCIFEEKKYLCEIFNVTQDECTAIIKKQLSAQKSLMTTNLIVGVIREQKWDLILQKATELGIDNIYPVIFSRNVVNIDPKKEEAKLSRWQNICVEAAKQSKRLTIPKIHSIIRDINKINNINSDLKLVAWEQENEKSFKQFLKTNWETINIIIGPEGGISESEISKLQQMNYKTVSLGDNILRAETAAIYALSAIVYEKND